MVWGAGSLRQWQRNIHGHQLRPRRPASNLHSASYTVQAAQCTVQATQCKLHSVHTAHSASCNLHTASYTVQAAQCKLHSVHTAHSASCNLHTASVTLQATHCTLQLAHCWRKVTASCTLDKSAQCPLHEAGFQLHIAWYSMCNVQCAMCMCNVHCTMIKFFKVAHIAYICSSHTTVFSCHSKLEAVSVKAHCTMHDKQCPFKTIQKYNAHSSVHIWYTHLTKCTWYTNIILSAHSPHMIHTYSWHTWYLIVWCTNDTHTNYTCYYMHIAYNIRMIHILYDARSCCQAKLEAPSAEPTRIPSITTGLAS